MITRKAEQLFGSTSQPRAGRRDSDNRQSFDERLNRILEAATGTMARVGYKGASMRAVAKEAGTSLAGLYHYFESKEKMLFLIQFRAFSSLLNNLKEKLHGVEDPFEQLRVMVRAHVAYFAANMAALKVCSHELDSLTGSAYEETRRIRHKYYNLTRSIVERVLQRKATGSTPDLHAVTMSLFGMLNWLYRWYDPRGGCSPTALANQIAGLFLNGICGGHDEGGHGGSQPSELKTEN
ncbi:MAG: TetR/AcrR family transcriptional regulator [Planctomycetota bacterium]|jgi:AcrR family transcriptional regulator